MRYLFLFSRDAPPHFVYSIVCSGGFSWNIHCGTTVSLTNSRRTCHRQHDIGALANISSGLPNLSLRHRYCAGALLGLHYSHRSDLISYSSREADLDLTRACFRDGRLDRRWSGGRYAWVEGAAIQKDEKSLRRGLVSGIALRA